MSETHRSELFSFAKRVAFLGVAFASLASLAGAGLASADPAAADAPRDPSAEPERPTVEAEITVTSTLPEMITETRSTGAEIESTEAIDLAEHLRTLPGLSAVRRGSINLEPTVRGLQEEQIALTVDGTRTFAAGPGRMDSNLSHVGLHSIEAVRVVKGPYALAWGSGALSAIDLVTHRPAPSSGTAGAAGTAWANNGDRTDTFANVRHGGERFRFHLGVGHRSGDDYETGDGVDVPGDYRSTEARWRFGYLARPRLLLDYSGGYQHQDDLDYPGRLLDATYFYARSHALEIDWSGDGDGPLARVYAQAYANRKDHRMNNDEKPTARDMPGRMPPFGIRVDLPTESNTTGARLRFDGRAASRAEDASISWSAGADLYRLEQNATRTISRRSNDFVLFTDTVWPDATIENAGLYFQVVRGSDRVRLGATVRVDAVQAEAGDPSAFFLADRLARTGSDDLDAEETNWSAAVSTTWAAGDWSFDIGAGRAVRSATVIERYSDRFPATKFQLAAEFLGHPDLDPEASLELDLAARRRGARWSIEISGFLRRIDDYITVVPDASVPRRLPLSPPTVYRYVNGDEATFRGAELAFEHRTTDRVTWRVDADWIRGDDESLDEPVLGLPPLTVHVGARAEIVPDRLVLDAGVRWLDDQDRVAVSRFEQPTEGATLLALGLEWHVGDWRFDLDVENLTDEAYAEHLNAPNPFTRERIFEPGRTLRLAARVDF